MDLRLILTLIMDVLSVIIINPAYSNNKQNEMIEVYIIIVALFHFCHIISIYSICKI
ncbi:hypothetical protein GLOIN_2v1500262 [Rhizophagus irregularis DAOM 181602=DAOM 197198]|uniref:Uncharacterized protein n=1 Tax=Rhizophagus irregularis (strain DAOM 181602 / DAOM 197198 / MUCL 43194) TaxID=747089 RepID=A0A2P4QX51_RHIID|nr:hypothetical protein GLOIN_2v1500262 [Rhizophagus irregularis DAOM 181602=DAOM 197198]POG82246.1 hypothetical protein GLOIN_2v1500262 [Rhizophagus irregularis DAOM 181602=DAOM 197198]|eukprot:XP_025189112.1 hypothetical protein GLOIN_2v1500262 [Rhizophagus irregularis DAOM 181602=DAOM 197198]